LADKQLRATPEQLCDALGACTELKPVYRRLLKMALEQLQFLEQQISQLDQEMANLLSHHQDAVKRLAEVPGLGVDSAQQIIAEVGPTAVTFPSEKQLSSWVGVCSGDDESAGVNYSHRSPNGNRHMRRVLNQAANAAARTKGSIFEIVYRRSIPRLGHNQAIGAIAHRQCRLIWLILHQGVRYEERGPAVTTRSKQKRTQNDQATPKSRLPDRTTQFSTPQFNTSAVIFNPVVVRRPRLGRKEPDMIIIGVDYHPSFQQIAFMDQETGECGERELNHSDGEAERFYRELKERGGSVRVEMEATGHARWFERLLAELGFELWIGDPAEIKTKRVRKQKTDREDARLMLKLLLENRFPRIWVPSPENRDLRQLLWHRHRLVQMRTRIMNQLQAVAMNEGYRWKKKLFGQQGRALLEKLSLAPWASRRRKELLELLDQLDPKIAELTAAVEREANKRPEVVRLMTHPGVGPITGVAYVLVIGTPDRFPCGKKIGSYTGLIPCEDSSAGRQRLGHISKQGNTLLRFLLVEAAQAAARCDADWRRRYMHLMMRREKGIAKVAMARKLAVRLYWMWRNNWQYSQLVEFGSNAGKLGTVHGMK